MKSNLPRLPFELKHDDIGSARPSYHRYYQVAGITVRVESDIPITRESFAPSLRQFETESPGEEDVLIRHYFELPRLDGYELGPPVHQRDPWSIHRIDGSWVYLGYCMDNGIRSLQRIAVVNDSHTNARIYNAPLSAATLSSGLANSLTLFPTDQVILARVLADRQACYLHSAGVVLSNRGLLFVGHSGAGKSTIVNMLLGNAEVLCDDRNIVRCSDDGTRVFGTWSHGDITEVSSASAPLAAILFLHQSDRNRIMPIDDRKLIIGRLLACLIRPMLTRDWWEKELALIDLLSGRIPCYDLEFDQTGDAIRLLRGIP